MRLISVKQYFKVKEQNIRKAYCKEGNNKNVISSMMSQLVW